MKKKYIFYLAVVLTFIVSFGIGGNYLKKSRVKGMKTLECVKERVLRLNFSEGDVPSLDPHDLAMSARGLSLGKWMFEGLTRFGLKKEYELSGAEKVEISPCQKEYLFTLRSNCYSDGTPVVAQDYERAWKKALSPKSKCGKAHLFYPIKNAEKAKKGEVPLDEVGVKAIDEKRLRIELCNPTPYFLSLVASPLFAPFKIEGKKIIGNGPYAVEEWKKEEFLLLKQNPFFWDRNRIQIKQIRISGIKDDITALSLKEKGEIDWVGAPFNEIPSDVLEEKIAQGELVQKQVVRPFWIFMNTETTLLSSSLVRRALSSVIERDMIAEHIFTGSQFLKTPLPPLFSSCECETEKGSLSEAKELFASGLKEVGLTQETLPSIVLSSCHLLNHRRLVNYLKERWEKVFGIQVDLNIQEWNTFYGSLQKGNYEIGSMFVSSDYRDPFSLLENLAYDWNFSRWRHSLYRKAIEKIKQATDQETRSEYLKEAETILNREIPVIPIFNECNYQYISSNLKNVVFDHRGTPDISWAFWGKEKHNGNPRSRLYR